MKKYLVKLLTQSGIIERIVFEDEDINELEKEIQNKYGSFTTLSSTLLN